MQSLGVGTDAATIYLALIAEPGLSRAELAARSGLRAPEFDAAVAQLADLRLIELADSGSAGQAVPQLADPDLALSAALRRREAELARQEQELAEARATIAAAAAAYQTSVGHSARCARTVTNRLEALDLARQLIMGAVGQCLMALPDPAGTLGQACEQIPNLTSRGTRVAIICTDAARSGPGRARLEVLERAGAQVRTLPMLTAPLIAAGPPPAALLWSGLLDTSASSVLVRDQVFAGTVATIFESQWDVATPLGKSVPPDPVTGLTPADQALLTLLASGLSGETAARHLGTSLTTVRRQMAELKDTLHADTLFQAGCLAAKRGWV